MSTTPTFDLSAAKTKAGDKDSEKATLAAGRLSNAVDRLITKVMSSDDHDDLQKEAVLSAASSNVLMLFGAPGQQPRAVGAGTQPVDDPQPTRSRRSGDEDSDLADQLARANTAKTTAETAKKTAEEELKKVLKAVGEALGGVNIPLVDSKVTSNIKDMIIAGLEEAERQSKAAAIGDGNVPKAEVKAAVGKIGAGWAKKHTAFGNDNKVVIDKPEDWQQIDDGLTELNQLLS